MCAPPGELSKKLDEGNLSIARRDRRTSAACEYVHGGRDGLGTTYGLHHDAGDLIRVGVGRGSAILKVSVALLSALARDPDRGATVRDAVGEGVDGAGLVAARETQRVVLAVDGDVLLVAALELLDRGLDVLHAARLAHVRRREVAVEAGAVPVAWDRLGVEGDLGAELLGDAVEQETGDPEVVTH